MIYLPHSVRQSQHHVVVITTRALLTNDFKILNTLMSKEIDNSVIVNEVTTKSADVAIGTN